MASRKSRPADPSPTALERESFEDYLLSRKHGTLDRWLVHVRARLYARAHGRRDAETIAEAFIKAHPEMIAEENIIRPSDNAGRGLPSGLRRASVKVPDGPSPALARDLRTGLVKEPEGRTRAPEVRTEVKATAPEGSDPEAAAPAEVPRSEPKTAPHRRPFTGSVPIA